MKSYDPLVQVPYSEWLVLDEDQRIALVKNYHESLEEELEEGALNLHSSLHVVVENQLALGEDYVIEAVARLMRQGEDRHEAIHAVAAVLSEGIFNTLKGGSEAFEVNNYRRKLEKITSKRWRKGQI